MKYLSVVFCALILMFSVSACASTSTCLYKTVHGICQETIDEGEYCFTHSCLYSCDNPVSSGSHFCEEHRCQFDIGYGRCDNGVDSYARDNGEIYCDDHREIGDIEEFAEAKQIAGTWCNTVAADATGNLLSPFKFTGDFYIDASSYKFYVEEIEYPYRDGYVIVLRNADGTLECDGMRYY